MEPFHVFFFFTYLNRTAASSVIVIEERSTSLFCCDAPEMFCYLRIFLLVHPLIKNVEHDWDCFDESLWSVLTTVTNTVFPIAALQLGTPPVSPFKHCNVISSGGEFIFRGTNRCKDSEQQAVMLYQCHMMK